jgi:hypothetical protein
MRADVAPLDVEYTLEEEGQPSPTSILGTTDWMCMWQYLKPRKSPPHSGDCRKIGAPT